jgi:hypothetical protein
MAQEPVSKLGHVNRPDAPGDPTGPKVQPSRTFLWLEILDEKIIPSKRIAIMLNPHLALPLFRAVVVDINGSLSANLSMSQMPIYRVLTPAHHDGINW